MDATIATIAREPLTYTGSGAVRPASLNRETYASLMGVILAPRVEHAKLCHLYCNLGFDNLLCTGNVLQFSLTTYTISPSFCRLDKLIYVGDRKER